MADKHIVVNVSLCKYPVVRDCARARGWRLIKDKDDDSPWDLWWQDVSVSTDRVTRMSPWMKINHIPGMAVLHTKTGLARTLNRMCQVFAVGYDFFPRTFCLPEMWTAFAEQFSVPSGISETAGIRRSKHVFIVKPAASCQGRGIYLTKNLSEVDQRVSSIAQRYIGKPFLIDGLKFDLRIYVLVSCVEPLRIFLFDDGLARFATTPYVAPNQRNMGDMTTHLTNYAIQKQSSNFVFNTGGVEGSSTGSKRSLTWFKGWLDDHGYSSRLVFGRIEHMINKALIAAQPHLSRMYRSAAGGDGSSISGSHSRCFEVLGLDVLLDSRLRPWLIEVNHSPSFTCDTPLDLDIKTRVIGEAMDLMRLRVSERKKLQETQGAATRQRLYGSSSPLAAAAAAAPSSASGSGASTSARGAAMPRPLQRASSVGVELMSRAAPPRGSPAPTGGGGSVAGRLLELRGAQSAKGDAIASGSGMLPSDYSPSAGDYNPGAGVDRGMLNHEAVTARDYKIIYPLPNPALVADAVFAENHLLAQRMSSSVAALNASKGKGTKTTVAAATEVTLGDECSAEPIESVAEGSPTSPYDDGAVGFVPSTSAGAGDSSMEGARSESAKQTAFKLRRVSAHELQLRGRVLKEQLRRPGDAGSDSDASVEPAAAPPAGCNPPSSPSHRRSPPTKQPTGISTTGAGFSPPKLAARPASARTRVAASQGSGGAIDLAPPSPDQVAAGRAAIASLHAAQLTAVVNASLRKEAAAGSGAGPTGVPAAYAVPWDASRDALEARLKQYRAYVLVAQELHDIELAATSGRRINDQQLAATAAIIAAAAHSVNDGAVKETAAAKAAASVASPPAALPSPKLDAKPQTGIGVAANRAIPSKPPVSAAPSPLGDAGLAHFIRTVRSLAGVTGKPRDDGEAAAASSHVRGVAQGPGERDAVVPVPLVPRVAVLAQAKQAAEAARRVFAEETRLGSLSGLSPAGSVIIAGSSTSVAPLAASGGTSPAPCPSEAVKAESGADLSEQSSRASQRRLRPSSAGPVRRQDTPMDPSSARTIEGAGFAPPNTGRPPLCETGRSSVVAHSARRSTASVARPLVIPIATPALTSSLGVSNRAGMSGSLLHVLVATDPGLPGHFTTVVPSLPAASALDSRRVVGNAESSVIAPAATDSAVLAPTPLAAGSARGDTARGSATVGEWRLPSSVASASNRRITSTTSSSGASGSGVSVAGNLRRSALAMPAQVAGSGAGSGSPNASSCTSTVTNSSTTIGAMLATGRSSAAAIPSSPGRATAGAAGASTSLPVSGLTPRLRTASFGASGSWTFAASTASGTGSSLVLPAPLGTAAPAQAAQSSEAHRSNAVSYTSRTADSGVLQGRTTRAPITTSATGDSGAGKLSVHIDRQSSDDESIHSPHGSSSLRYRPTTPVASPLTQPALSYGSTAQIHSPMSPAARQQPSLRALLRGAATAAAQETPSSLPNALVPPNGAASASQHPPPPQSPIRVVREPTAPLPALSTSMYGSGWVQDK